MIVLSGTDSTGLSWGVFHGNCLNMYSEICLKTKVET